MKLPFTYKQLLAAFEVDLPRNLILTNSYDDSITETKSFRNIAWNEATPEMLQKNFEVAYSFSPEAMYYFLPAFINCSLYNLNKVLLPLDYLLGCMSATENAIWMKWRKARWERLSAEQWGIIDKWLLWLQELPEAKELSNLSGAFEAVSQRIWSKL
jgi:hypothetical protein